MFEKWLSGSGLYQVL